MKLVDYLNLKEISPAKLAEAIEVPPSTITRILRGERQPRLRTIQKITRATKGAVTAADFMSEAAA